LTLNTEALVHSNKSRVLSQGRWPKECRKIDTQLSPTKWSSY